MLTVLIVSMLFNLILAAYILYSTKEHMDTINLLRIAENALKSYTGMNLKDIIHNH